jgi:hypothetical protein
VKRAQAHLLEQLYSHLSTLSGGDTESLLEEDPEVSHRRARAKQARRRPGPQQHAAEADRIISCLLQLSRQGGDACVQTCNEAQRLVRASGSAAYA